MDPVGNSLRERCQFHSLATVTEPPRGIKPIRFGYFESREAKKTQVAHQHDWGGDCSWALGELTEIVVPSQ